MIYNIIQKYQNQQEKLIEFLQGRGAENSKQKSVQQKKIFKFPKKGQKSKEIILQMNSNLSEIQNLYQLSNRDSRSNYSIVSEDLGQQLFQLIQEYQPNPEDQALLELSKQKTVQDIDEKFRNSNTNQTFIFPRKITKRDRNKAKELSQILANSVQNKYLNRKLGNQNFTSTQFQEDKNKQNFTKHSQFDQRSQLDNQSSDDSYSSLQDCTFYDLNSQNNYNWHKKSTQIKTQDNQQHDFYINSDIQEELYNKQHHKQSQQGSLQKAGMMIKQEQGIPIHSDLFVPNSNIQHQQTQFMKQTINYNYQQNNKSNAYNQQSIEGQNELEKTNFNKQSSTQKNLKYNELIDQQQQNGIQGRQIDNEQNDENQDLTISGIKLEQIDQNQQRYIKNQKALLNNLVQSHSNPKKINTKIKNNEHKEFIYKNINSNSSVNQNIDRQNSYKHQRKPLTETSPNSKNLNYLNQTEIIQGVSSSTGITTGIKEQISYKNKGSNHTHHNNRSDNNLKNSRIQFVQQKGVFTETNEEFEDSKINYTQKEDIKLITKIKRDNEGNQSYKFREQNLLQFENIATEIDLNNNLPSKQFYNVPPTQILNGKVRKLKIGSFHQQKDQYKSKINQSSSIHNSINFNNSNNHYSIPNNHSQLSSTLNQPLSVQSKTQNTQPYLDKLNFSSIKGVNNNQQQKKILNTSFSQNQQQLSILPQYTLPHDLNDIQFNPNFLCKLTKYNGNNQSIISQNNQHNEQKNQINKILNYPQTTQNNNQKQFIFSQEGKLIKSIQQPYQTGNNNIYSHHPNNNLQNVNIVNTSLDQQRFENRFTPLRANKIGGQTTSHRTNQLQLTNNTLNTFTYEENTKNQNDLSQSYSKSRNNTYLSTSKGCNTNKNQQQGFTPTSSQANQLNKRNKTSIRKLRPKINTEGSFNDLSDIIGTTSKECNVTQQIDPTPYLQASKHLRNQTINSYYLKPSTTKNSHSRQLSDDFMRSSIINRVFTDKSEDKIKSIDTSQCTSGIGGKINYNKSDIEKNIPTDSNKKIYTDFDKVTQIDLNNVNSKRCPSGNFSKIKRTLKVQSCKYNAQKNLDLQEQFNNTQQQSNNQLQNNNTILKQNISNQQEEDDNLHIYKIDMKNHIEQIRNPNKQQNHQQQDLNKDHNNSQHSQYLRNQQEKNIYTNNEEVSDKGQKNVSEENKILKFTNKIPVTETNKKRIIINQHNSNSKSQVIVQPITLDTFCNENQISHQQDLSNQNSSQNNKNQKINFQIKQDNNLNIKCIKKAKISSIQNQNQFVDQETDNKNVNKSQQINKDSFELQENSQNQYQQDQETSNLYKLNNNQNVKEQVNIKSEQLNQILQHAQQDIYYMKQQQNASNPIRQIKTFHLQSNSLNFEANQLSQNGNQLIFNQCSQKTINNDNPESFTIIQEKIQNNKLIGTQQIQEQDCNEQILQIQNQYLDNQVNQKSLQSSCEKNIKQDTEKNSNVNISSGSDLANTQQILKKVINKTVGYSNIYSKDMGNIPSTTKPKALQIAYSLFNNNNNNSNQQNLHNTNGVGNLCAQVTASSTQSNNSKNKSPLRLNFTSNQIPSSSSNQKPQSIVHQASVSLQKKKTNQLYQSVTEQSQSITNQTTHN